MRRLAAVLALLVSLVFAIWYARPREFHWSTSVTAREGPPTIAPVAPTTPATAATTQPPPAPATTQSETVYITRSGSKYHRAHCPHLRKSRIPMPIDEARKFYSACLDCF